MGPRARSSWSILAAGSLPWRQSSDRVGDTQGLEFEQSLVDDGSGGLCTRNRVSPYALASAGAPLAALAPGSYQGMMGGLIDLGGAPKFCYASTARGEFA